VKSKKQSRKEKRQLRPTQKSYKKTRKKKEETLVLFRKRKKPPKKSKLFSKQQSKNLRQFPRKLARLQRHIERNLKR
jgi:hypothetical protein